MSDHRFTVSRSTVIAASAELVFAYVDDVRNLARHMSERRSMPMLGSKLDLEIVTPKGSGIGATYHYRGRIMGLEIDFSETVTGYVSGREKVWRTIGKPQLLIIDSYEMRTTIDRMDDGRSNLTISIDYSLPSSGVRRVLGRVLAHRYAEWCIASMLEGARHDLQRSVP